MSEVKVVSEDNKEYKIELQGNDGGLLNGASFEWDIHQVKNNSYHVFLVH